MSLKTPDGLPAELNGGAGGYLGIDLGALRDNYIALSERAAPAKTSAVVKANAYGLGASEVTRTLYEAGCRDFFVAIAREAFDLHPLLADDVHIYILNGLLPGSETLCAEHGFIPVLNSPQQIENWANAARDTGKFLPAVLQFDTGMSRLGLSPDEAHALAESPDVLKYFDLRYLMSHLACADEPDNPANDAQLSVLGEMTALFPDVPVCFANSGGIFMGGDYRQALVRPGIALYGGAPNAERPSPMKPVISLHVAVIQTRTVPAGTQIGYGGTATAETEMRLATLSAGYADGLPRALSNRGSVWFNGIRLPITGRVSMDSIIVDISALPEGALGIGDYVEVIGPHQSLDELAADAGTIAYEILTGLGRRYQRQYSGGVS
ncbi:alanine racemase [Asticcacaulis tiandongensis]|uniref:alanine racemase n=1 Tax=Asticcacaulis tiandongensis TaxID=2565365 RepID=UPI00112E8B14|nr:alanine racemase [Asticcacaulis tiandongensis]